MTKDYYAFPARFHFNIDDSVLVTFPDLPGCMTSGKNQEEALIMARDVLGGFLSIMEEDNDPIPSPSQITDIINENSNEHILLIDVRMPPYRNKDNVKLKKKTLTIPQWLDEEAVKKNINQSKLLTEALKEHLGYNDKTNTP
ncbi:type II toxin-antitoxin system HicB family antitoxin [Bacillus cereus]|uniref:type II toxin-antitoxin system HicB family antitoxin n=1 Tax=Bacillus cereus group TaxID=86661 RepID=UPI0004452133|nr:MULTISPECIES: type II toxin-antitoxin system HicB family antitoxin [Bacillus cereus group]EXY06191.1 pilus assembly protein HicB [Bacillus thuringiensis]MEB8632256.1 type II toxin-antitoxin system HicB family antitoxin [Bacillus cereus]MEB8756026.1 type II toxin-antitoxin system HicB family antitoxin [Bacillus cereus]MEB8798177.1 type II toxin-antitoxin system HicB family antitoxin [Bacillus cereus]MEB8808608.1 type II toxin-antitoxin system HicB family antitoxin [Bacillus cereus]